MLKTPYLVFSFFLLITLALFSPPNSHAILVGAESNGEIANSNVSHEARKVALLKMHSQGTQLVRVNISWNDIAANCDDQTPQQLAIHTNPCYNWAITDSFVSLSSSMDMERLVSFTRPPAWASGSADPSNMGNNSSQFYNVVVHYSAFMKAAGTRYNKGSEYGVINYWTIFNEPNSATFWKPKPDANRYGILYANAAVALREVHPTAKIAPGPTNPTGNGKYSIAPLKFIKDSTIAMNKYLPGNTAKKRSYIDAWAHNPYPSAGLQPSVANPKAPERIIGMAKVNKLIKELDKHPLTRNKKIWATEFGWETSKAPQITSEKLQAQFIAEAFDHLEATRRVDIGVNYILTDPTDPVDWQSGTYRPNGKLKPSGVMMRRMVSVPQAKTNGKVKKGTAVRIFGRSNISPLRGQLVYKIGNGKWKAVPGQKKKLDGSIRATFRVTRPVSFAVRDNGSAARKVAKGTGMTRTVKPF